MLSAEWVEVVEEAKARATAVPVPAGYTSNENTGGGRLIVIVIDRIGIRFGGNTAMMNTLLGFIDRLQPSDRVAVVGFGPDNPPLEFIADLERVKELVTRMTGQKQPGAPTTYNVGLGESLSIVRGELGMLDGAVARECVNLPPRSFQLNVCSTGVKDDAGQIAREALEQADTTIIGMSNLFTTLRAIDGPKTVVMVSEGFVVDDYQTFAETAGLMAAAARASLYVMHLNDTAFDSGSGRRPPSAIEDRRIRVLGLEALTKVARRLHVHGERRRRRGVRSHLRGTVRPLSAQHRAGPPRFRRQAALDQHPGAVERRRRAIAPAPAERGAGLGPQHAAESGGGRPELSAAASHAAASGGDICAAGLRAGQDPAADSRGHRPRVQRRQARVDRLRDPRSDPAGKWMRTTSTAGWPP